jgi:hypothetical protein
VGAACDGCAADHYGYPECAYCDGQATCSGHGQCTPTGACACDAGYGGASCVDCGTTTVEAVCDDGIDSDCDFTIDCLDTDCCTDGACAWADADGDSYAACDCNDHNNRVWATPSEAFMLVLSHDPAVGTTLTWYPPLEPGGTKLTYQTLRFDDPGDFDLTALCLAADPLLTTSVDAENPATGYGFFYLVRARNTCPLGLGPLGTDSSGDPRTGTCP